MKKQLLIGSLMILPAGLNAMDWTPYHNPGTVGSLREIVNNQVGDIRFQNEMDVHQINAQRQATLAMAQQQIEAQEEAQRAAYLAAKIAWAETVVAPTGPMQPLTRWCKDLEYEEAKIWLEHGKRMKEIEEQRNAQ
jgi:hypothetical protein